MAARLLAVFTIKKAKDASGAEINVEEKFNNEGLFVYDEAHLYIKHVLISSAERPCHSSANSSIDRTRAGVCWNSVNFNTDPPSMVRNFD